ncbi:MAG: hypothetical protein KA713_18720 [Chryseotalea sp. WA131a]|nr:MAG: hypothetical protein KA713_18720 [Chryseotalea sp. WA131a]
MKVILFAIMLVVSIKCSAQTAAAKNDTILKNKNGALLLDNGFAIPPFSVSGDIYITQNLFIFHPKPYHRARYEMYNDLVKDFVLPYDSILVAKKVIGGFTLKTKTKKYKIATDGGKGKETVTHINRLRKQHETKQAKAPR